MMNHLESVRIHLVDGKLHVTVWINENPENQELGETQCVGSLEVDPKRLPKGDQTLAELNF
jgi:hypothetical protein